MAYTPPEPISQDPEPEILNPVTNQPERDPLMRFAIEKGHWYTDRLGRARPNWTAIKREVFPHWKIPRYFGFTEEEKETYYKLCAEAFYPLKSVGYLLGFRVPSAGVRFVTDYKIPVYRISRFLYVFSGDIVRAVSGCKIDPEDVVAQKCLEHQGKRWDRTTPRDDPSRAPGDAIRYESGLRERKAPSTEVQAAGESPSDG